MGEGHLGKSLDKMERKTWQMLLDLLANVSAASSGSSVVVHLVVLGCPVQQHANCESIAFQKKAYLRSAAAAYLAFAVSGFLADKIAKRGQL